MSDIFQKMVEGIATAPNKKVALLMLEGLEAVLRERRARREVELAALAPGDALRADYAELRRLSDLTLEQLEVLRATIVGVQGVP